MLWKRFSLTKSPSPPSCPLPNNVTLFRKRPRSARTGNMAIAATGIDMVYHTSSQSFQALKGVDIALPTGEVHMVVGPSGAGKTTLLLILAGLLTPTQGQIYLLDQDVTRYSRRQLDRFRLKNIGILFQESNLLRSLTALENVVATLSLKGIHGRAAQQEAHRLLAAVGLEDRTHHLPRQLSGGQQQRVAIARALAGNPALLFADEPTAALDSTNGHRVVESMRRLAKEQGTTVLIATHDPRILSFADHIAQLNDGVLQPAESQL